MLPVLSATASEPVLRPCLGHLGLEEIEQWGGGGQINRGGDDQRDEV